MNNENQNNKEENLVRKMSTKIAHRPSIKAMKKIIIEFGDLNKNLQNNKKFGNNEITTTKYNVIT